jgi:hypothetical protein
LLLGLLVGKSLSCKTDSNAARCAKIAKPETLVETLHVTSLQGLTKAVLRPILPLWSNVEFHRLGNDDYTQAGDLYRLMTPDEQERLIENIVGSLSGARRYIQMRQLCHFFRADVKYGMRIAQGFGIAIDRSMIPRDAQPVGVSKLRENLESGKWDEKYGRVKEFAEIDAGYRFLTARL